MVDSVKASLLLVLIPNVPESHNNCSILMKYPGLGKIKHLLAAELKLRNALKIRVTLKHVALFCAQVKLLI